MTIGVVATGSNIAHDVVRAFKAIESIASGAIGGFVTMVVSTQDGKNHYFETQNGGVTSLYEQVLSLENANQIGLISSGAYRPTPLSRFLAWDDDGNIVSGHRFPQLESINGLPLNKELLTVIQEQGIQSLPLNSLLAANPSIDAGYVATDKKGKLFQADCEFVQQRKDRYALCERKDDRSIAITLNSISPAKQVAEMICRIAMDKPEASQSIKLDLGAIINTSRDNAIHVDACNKVTSIETCDKNSLSPSYEGPLFVAGTPVYLSGELQGFVVDEPYTRCSGGKIQFLCGADEVELSMAPI